MCWLFPAVSPWAAVSQGWFPAYSTGRWILQKQTRDDSQHTVRVTESCKNKDDSQHTVRVTEFCKNQDDSQHTVRITESCKNKDDSQHTVRITESCKNKPEMIPSIRTGPAADSCNNQPGIAKPCNNKPEIYSEHPQRVDELCSNMLRPIQVSRAELLLLQKSKK